MVTDEEFTGIGNEDLYEKLLDFYQVYLEI